MGNCETCVLSPYCTRKNINRIDGYCRLDTYSEKQKKKAICNSLWLAGDEKWKDYED